MSKGVEHPEVHPVRERIVDQKRGHQEQPGVAHVFQPVTLQRAEVVGVSELAAQLFQDGPVPVAAGGPELTREVLAEVLFHAVVVEQRVIAVEEKDDVIWRRYGVSSSSMGLCQPPSAAMSASASLGPQLPGL